MAQQDEDIVSLEKEVHVRQVARRGRDSGTSSNTSTTSEVNITIHEETYITIRDKRLSELREYSAAVLNISGNKKDLKPAKIQRVPTMLQDHENFDKYFIPRVAANGPFHHGNPKYKPAEKVKLQLVANFLIDSKQKDEVLLQTIEANIKVLREWYEEQETKDYNDEALAWMLFVDGCSTLEFIYKYDELEKFQIKRDMVAFAEQDLFLLENQLPYELLNLLKNNSDKKEDLEKKIDEFVEMHGVMTDPSNSSCLATFTSCNAGKPIENVTTDVVKKPTHLLDLLRTKMLGPPRTKGNANSKQTKRPSFRNVQELRTAGIFFCRSNGKSLWDIQFKSYLFFGCLSLPKIKVDDSTGPKFMNLIAYEMCPDFENDFGVTSYITFMDSLIDHPDDVKHLRKEEILHNLLGCDEEVTKIFNEIGTDLVPNEEIYKGVKGNIEDHYQRMLSTWMAQGLHDHFSSPWTILAFIGVLFGLWMSAVQTWYTVYSDPPCVVCK